QCWHAVVVYLNLLLLPVFTTKLLKRYRINHYIQENNGTIHFGPFTMPALCEICNESERKYRCKTCSIHYCSVPCYKKHQEQPCEPLPAAAACAQETAPQKDHMGKKTILFSTVDTVAAEKLEQLGQSEHLKNLLYNPHLRQLLTEVDDARDGMNAVKVAMMEPLFVEFADECLRIVEPQRNETEDNLHELVFTNRQHRR
uniref:HIT-type domain-containing protein n=1 Tax=Anopheles dirus TaxID=7168 RepID=A0A182N3Z1_9DIPT